MNWPFKEKQALRDLAVTSHLQLWGHVPDADLSIVAAGDDGGQVVHHQQAGDAVSGSIAAPQNYG